MRCCQEFAYHQIWVEGAELKLTDEDARFVDPLYGKTYLPRKFKGGLRHSAAQRH